MTHRLTAADRATLSPDEKRAIRAMPCGRCGAAPPFLDGGCCHVHRLVPANGYVRGNVVPRCPECHSREPGHRPFTRLARHGGQAGGFARDAKLTQSQKSEIGRRAAQAWKARHQSTGLSEKELARNRANAAAIALKLTPAERSAINRRGWETRRSKNDSKQQRLRLSNGD